MSAIESIASLFLKNLGNDNPGLSVATLLPALTKLLPSKGGDLDMGGLVEKFTSKADLSSLAASWLGNGQNEGLDASQLLGVLGDGAVGEFAESTGLSASTASSALAKVIPDFIDSNSDGGDLVGGVLKGALGKLF